MTWPVLSIPRHVKKRSLKTRTTGRVQTASARDGTLQGLARREARAPRLWPGLGLILAFNGLFILWQHLHPANQNTFVAVDNVAQFLGPLLVLPWRLARPWSWRRGADNPSGRARTRGSWSPILLGLGILSWALGQVVWTYEESVLHQPPFPSWSDVGYLAGYPIITLGILLLPVRRLPLATLLRLLLDSAMSMTAVVTFSWYFLLGPTFLGGADTLLAKAVGTAYPLWDLVLMLCLLLIAARSSDPALRWPVGLLALGLCVIVATDSVFNLQQLHGVYATGALTDVGWPLGYMLLGLGARTLRLSPPGQRTVRQADDGVVDANTPARGLALWSTLLPYALIPAVGALLAYTIYIRADDALQPGVYVGATVLTVLVVVRQVVALLENRVLYRSLRDAYQRLEESNHTTMAHARHTVQLNEDLRHSEERFRALVEHASDMVSIVDADGVLRYVSPSHETVLGYAPGQLEGKNIFALVYPDGRDKAIDLFANHRQGTPVPGPAECRVRHADGSWLTLEITGNNRLDDPAVRGIILNSHDVTLRKQIEETLQHQAHHDPLTDLPNRVLLHQQLGQALREKGSLALLVMDLDHFKEINDTLGHHYGDLLLQQVSDRVRGVLRSSDTVARLGGDEFGLLLPGADAAGALSVASAVRAVLDTPFSVEKQTLTVKASIGVALAPAHGADAATLLRRADVAMYLAKRSGDGGALYDVAQDDHSPARLSLVSELQHAVDEGDLLLHYQPLVELATGRLVAVEALLRWPHPEHGLILPDGFIPLAEHNGLIAPLTRWALNAALRQCRLWQRAGLRPRMHVNLSMHDLHDVALPDRVAELLRQHDVAADALTLEITESALMADPARALDVLTRLAHLGVRSAIDDFGAGYSSLSYLKRLPVNAIKIDKSFVQGLRHPGDERSTDATIVRSVVALGHALGLEVVAEGIEHRVALDMLAALGCDAAQGYYLSRPLSARDMEGWAAAPRGLSRIGA